MAQDRVSLLASAALGPAAHRLAGPLHIFNQHRGCPECVVRCYASALHLCCAVLCCVVPSISMCWAAARCPSSGLTWGCNSAVPARVVCADVLSSWFLNPSPSPFFSSFLFSSLLLNPAAPDGFQANGYSKEMRMLIGSGLKGKGGTALVYKSVSLLEGASACWCGRGAV